MLISYLLQFYLPDFGPKRDLDILSNHLKRAVADLQEMTLRYEHLLKENQQLRKRLSKMNTDLDLYYKCLQCLEVRATNAEERTRDACSIEEKIKASAKECENCVNERFAYVAALLMKSTEEETKELRKQVEEGRKRNEELLRKLKESTSSKFSEYSLHLLNYCVFTLKVKRQ